LAPYGIFYFSQTEEVPMRWFLIWSISGALLGGIIATLVAPWMLRTLLATTGAADAMCQCSELVTNTANLLIKTQAIGIAIGGLGLPIMAGVMRWSRSRRSHGSLPEQGTAPSNPKAPTE
jgi:hypothetical protein